MKAKSASEERRTMNEKDFDREFDLTTMLDAWKIDPYTQEMLSRLGSDYDENGVPYWEKGGKS